MKLTRCDPRPWEAHRHFSLMPVWSPQSSSRTTKATVILCFKQPNRKPNQPKRTLNKSLCNHTIKCYCDAHLEHRNWALLSAKSPAFELFSFCLIKFVKSKATKYCHYNTTSEFWLQGSAYVCLFSTGITNILFHTGPCVYKANALLTKQSPQFCGAFYLYFLFFLTQDLI